MKTSSLQYNVTLSEEKLREINKIGLKTRILEKDRSPLPGEKDKFSESFKDVKVHLNKKEHLTLATYRQLPNNPSQAKAIMVVFHGMGGHANRFAHVAKAFSDANFICLSFDYPGCGRSDGLPGYTYSNQEMNLALDAFLSWVDQLYDSSLQRFMIGESMGGFNAIKMSIRHKDYFKGMILLAPAILNNFHNKNLEKKFGCFMAKIIPRTPLICFKFDWTEDSRNPENLTAIAKDPFIYKGSFRAGSVANIMEMMKICHRDMIQKVNIPFLIVQGGYDKQVDPQGAFDLVKKCQSQDKNFIFVEKMWHDIIHEPEIFEILQESVKWTLSRVKTK